MAYEARCEHRRIGVLTHLEAITGLRTTVFGPMLGCLECGVPVYLERKFDDTWIVCEDERGRRD